MAALDLLRRALPAASRKKALVEVTRDEYRIHPVLLALIAADKVTKTEAERAARVADETGEHIIRLLTRMELVCAEDWAIAAAKYHRIERAAKGEFPREPVLPDIISARYLKNAMLLPLDQTDDTIWLGMVDPSITNATKSVALAANRKVVPVAIALDDYVEAHARLYEAGAQAIEDIVSQDGGHDEVDALIGRAKDAPVVRLVNQLLWDAARLTASDMHIEPFRDRLRVRYRVHGMLRDAASPPANFTAAVISRFKILAKLDIAERRLPQDGQARLNIGDRRVDVRVATIPTIHGEGLVIRFLGVAQTDTRLESLGMNSNLEARLRRQFATPYGMLLVTGPTGSGKTTTLYAGLREINDEGRKILTIEDPVEYQIDGLTQVQVKSDIGLDFAKVLRSVVRHDPDVIMIGEMRDPETANIAVHAALTGHLMLSTLHTNSAAGAVARMLDMGVEAYLLASVLRGVIGQRLVGEICPHCREARIIRQAERAVFDHAGITLDEDSMLFEASGCDQCEDLGFVGRVGIFEYLEIDDALRELIRQKNGSQAISSAGQRAGMTTMLQYGLQKCLAGRTTFEEVARVTEDW